VAIKMPDAEQTAAARERAEWKRYADLIAQLEERIAAGQGDAIHFHQLGLARFQLNQPSEAVEALKRAVEIDRRFIHAWVGLGMVYDHLGQYEEAASANRTALDIAPGFVPARVNLGLMLNRLGRFNEAIDELTRVLHIEPKMPQALAGLFEACSALRRHDEARHFKALAEEAGVRFVE